MGRFGAPCLYVVVRSPVRAGRCEQSRVQPGPNASSKKTCCSLWLHSSSQSSHRTLGAGELSSLHGIILGLLPLASTPCCSSGQFPKHSQIQWAPQKSCPFLQAKVIHDDETPPEDGVTVSWSCSGSPLRRPRHWSGDPPGSRDQAWQLLRRSLPFRHLCLCLVSKADQEESKELQFEY